MAKAREDIELSEAVDATEKELFAAALGDEPAVHDDTGDQSIEHPDRGLEGDPEDLGDGTEVEAAPEGDDGEVAEGDEPILDDKAPKKDPDTGKFVKSDTAPNTKEPPPGRFREVSARAKAAEAERETIKAERDAINAQLADERKGREALAAQLELLSRQVTQRQQSEQPKPAPVVLPPRPDKFADPDGYDKWVEDTIERRAVAAQEEYSRRLVNMNLEMTRDAHGEKFVTAYNAIIDASQQDPEARIAINKALASPNAGREIMHWHAARETLREVGPDPAAYRKKVADETRAALLADPEFRKEILAGLKDEAAGRGNAAPRNVIRGPIRAGTTIPSLNGANGAAHLAELNQAAFDDPSDEGAFNRALS